MAPARHVLRAGVAAALVHVALGLTAALIWEAPVLAWWFGLSALLTATVTVVLARLVRPRPGGGEDPAPGASPPPDEDPPDWWPEFERAFGDYVARGREPV